MVQFPEACAKSLEVEMRLLPALLLLSLIIGGVVHAQQSASGQQVPQAGSPQNEKPLTVAECTQLREQAGRGQVLSDDQRGRFSQCLSNPPAPVTEPWSNKGIAPSLETYAPFKSPWDDNGV
jgi:hypothetical protein